MPSLPSEVRLEAALLTPEWRDPTADQLVFSGTARDGSSVFILGPAHATTGRLQLVASCQRSCILSSAVNRLPGPRLMLNAQVSGMPGSKNRENA